MTPTVDELREVGLRPCESPFRLRVRYRADERHGRIIHVEEYVVSAPKVGQRTLGEYWRRRRMVERHMAHWPHRDPEAARVLAIRWWAARRWKAWPKPGWKR